MVSKARRRSSLRYSQRRATPQSSAPVTCERRSLAPTSSNTVSKITPKASTFSGKKHRRNTTVRQQSGIAYQHSETTSQGSKATRPNSGTTSQGSGTTSQGSGTTSQGSGTTSQGSKATRPNSGTTSQGIGTTSQGSKASPNSGTTSQGSEKNSQGSGTTSQGNGSTSQSSGSSRQRSVSRHYRSATIQHHGEARHRHNLRSGKNKQYSNDGKGISYDTRRKKTAPANKRMHPKELLPLIEDILARINAIPVKGRPVPDTSDIDVLGVELKMRLATKSTVLVETGQRGGKVNVTPINQAYRLVPLWDINKNQDSVLLCQMKIKAANKRPIR